jgi:hypothetical protein
MEAYQTKLPDGKLRGADNGDVPTKPTKAGAGSIPSGLAPTHGGLDALKLMQFARDVSREGSPEYRMYNRIIGHMIGAHGSSYPQIREFYAASSTAEIYAMVDRCQEAPACR